MVKVLERNNVVLLYSVVFLKNKFWGGDFESCKNRNIERDLKGIKIFVMFRIVGI